MYRHHRHCRHDAADDVTEHAVISPYLSSRPERAAPGAGAAAALLGPWIPDGSRTRNSGMTAVARMTRYALATPQKYGSGALTTPLTLLRQAR